MTFTFIIMDSLYIMRNLLILFCLMVVFWTNLGNCAGFCDKYTQCHYDETWMHSTVSCNIETARGNTAPPCYGDGSIITCSCNNENYQLSSPNNSYLCRPDKWEDGLYDLHCLTGGLVGLAPIHSDTPTTPLVSPCDEPAPPDDLVFHSPDFAEGEMYEHGTQIMYDCPDGFDLNGHMTAVCLYGVWTYEDAYCTGSCDKYTQCHYNEARMDSTVNCTIETAGNTAHPCHGDGAIITCSCHNGNYQLSSPDNSYLCRPDKWEDGLYDLHCSRRELTTEMSTITPPARCDEYTQCFYDETRMHSNVNCSIERAGNTAPPCYGDGSNIICSCKSENYQLSSPNNSYLCRPDKWEDGLYDLHCWEIKRIIRSSLQLEVAYKEDFANKSSCTFLLLQQEICTAFNETFTRLDDKFNNWFDSCEVEAILKLEVHISADVVTRYDEDVAVVTPENFDKYIQSEAQSGLRLISTTSMVTPEDFATHIQSEAQYGLRLISITSEEESYNACEEGADICDPENGYYIYHNGTNYECRCKNFTIDGNQGNPALHGIECDWYCKEPPPAHFDVIQTPQNGGGWKDGSSLSYSCPNRFILHGSSSAVCLRGRWNVGTVPSCSDPFLIPLVIIIAIFTLLFAVLLIWLIKKHSLRRGTKWIPSVEGVANEQVPPTTNDESKFVSKITFEMSDPNGYQNDVNKEENDVTDHVGDNSPGDSPNNDPEEETV